MRSKNPGSYGSSTFNFYRSVLTEFHNDHFNMRATPVHKFFSISTASLTFAGFFEDRHFIFAEMITQSSNMFFLITEDVELIL